MNTILLLTLLALPPQVSGAPETALAPECNLGRDDGAHEAHTCPADYSEADCFWVWHCCEDAHGHRVLPFRNRLAAGQCHQGCGPAASFSPAAGCIPHPGAHVTEEGLAAYCQRFFPGDPDCGSS